MVIQCYQGSFVIVLICRHVSDLCELPIGIQNMSPPLKPAHDDMIG
jgi:hypothetical protein